jgi:hypothetical protein
VVKKRHFKSKRASGGGVDIYPMFSGCPNQRWFAHYKNSGWLNQRRVGYSQNFGCQAQHWFAHFTNTGCRDCRWFARPRNT